MKTRVNTISDPGMIWLEEPTADELITELIIFF